jgi:hypothetical protein
LWILAHDVIVVDLMFGNLITRRQTLPNADQWPSECSAPPLAASFSVYVFMTLNFVDI